MNPEKLPPREQFHAGHCLKPVEKLFDSLDANFLFASLIWGTIGTGYVIYGKKQGAMMPLIGGIAMIAVSYLVSSWVLMSLLSIGLIIAVYQLMKRGY